jgi:hypothetical protein
MAISWGAWSSNNRLRAGVDIIMSPSTITASTTKVTLTTKVYLQTRYASSEYTSSNTWYVTGTVTDGSGSTDWSLGAMGYKLMGSTTTTVTLTSSSQSKSATGRIKSNVAYAGTEATVTKSITVPALAIAAPAAPISLAMTRISDTSQKVSWTRQATTSAPYDSQIVYRKDNVSTAYAAIATVTGTTTSYTDTKTRNDRVYTYAVRAKNSGGYSAYAYSPSIATTPATPGAPTAGKTTTGDITVTRPAISGASLGGWEVWHAANGVWDAARLALVAYGTTTYTHVAPDPTKTHTYRLRWVSASPTLYSPNGATSSGVSPLTPPASPTDLAPSGVAQEAAEPVTFTWTHNPLDTTAQTAYEVQHRPVGGGTWTTTGKVTSTTSSRAWAANTWTNGQTIEWQVRTWGQHATASAWSASGTLTLSTRPTATVTLPADGVPWDSSRVRVEWAYFDAEGQGQTAWKATLYAEDGSALETKAGADSATSTIFATRVADGASYSVTVEVRDSTGLWSAADTMLFTTDFAVLPTPVVSAEFDPETASCGVYVTVPVPVSPQVAPDSAEVWRSINGGEWRLVADNLELTPLPPLVNYLPNPSFETDTTNWSPIRGTLASVADGTAVDGAKVMRYTSTDGSVAGGNYLYCIPTQTVTPGEEWTGSMSLRPSASVAATSTLQVWFQWYNGGTFLAQSPVTAQTLVPAGEWRRLSVTHTAPATATNVRVFGSVRPSSAIGNPVGSTYDVDAAMLERSPVLNAYYAGTVPQPSVVSITDSIPALNATNAYKAIVETDMGAFGEGAPVEVFTGGAKHLFVNAGPGFEDFVRVNSNVEVSLSSGRSRALRRAAGRALPVPFDGQQVTTEVSVSATLWRPDRAQERASEASSWQDIADFALSYSPACFRDPDGNRVFVSMAPVRIGGLGTGPVRSVSWSMTAVDYAEPLVSSTTL